jgi:hypothetical protein
MYPAGGTLSTHPGPAGAGDLLHSPFCPYIILCLTRLRVCTTAGPKPAVVV